jgi:hypothetical protein
MSKRLQVLIEDGEYRELQRVARSRSLTLSEWAHRIGKILSFDRGFDSSPGVARLGA